MAQEKLTHMGKKESTVKWFIFAIIPIVNLYFLWKAAESIAGHEKTIKERHETLSHSPRKESTGKWFLIFLIPYILGIAMIGIIVIGAISGSGGFLTGFIVTGGVLGVVILLVTIYILYKQAEVVSGHEKVYETHERIGHMDKKESTGKWLIFGIIPILDIYFLWKLAELISGHEVTYK